MACINAGRLPLRQTPSFKTRRAVYKLGEFRKVQYHYWSPQSGKPYARSRLYQHDTFYYRYLRYRSSPSLLKYGNNNDSLQAAPFSISSLYFKEQKPTAQNNSKDINSLESELENLYKDFYRLMKKDSDEAYKLLSRFIEKDPYRALFGWKGQFGAWNPWAGRSQIPKVFAKLKQQLNAYSEGNLSTSEKSSMAVKSTTTSVKDESTNSSPPQYTTTTEVETFRIDPITLKKVPLSGSASNNGQNDDLAHLLQNNNSQSQDISVKKVEPMNMTDLGEKEIQALAPRRQTPAPTLAGFANQPWLIKEGFKQQPVSESISTNDMTSPQPEDLAKSSKLEPSLDKFVSKSKETGKKLEYNPVEDQTEDIDLLRASDIRAAAGRLKQKPVQSHEEAQKRRQVLEKEFSEASSQYTEKMKKIYDELASKRILPQNLDKPLSVPESKVETPNLHDDMTRKTSTKSSNGSEGGKKNGKSQDDTSVVVGILKSMNTLHTRLSKLEARMDESPLRNHSATKIVKSQDAAIPQSSGVKIDEQDFPSDEQKQPIFEPTESKQGIGHAETEPLAVKQIIPKASSPASESHTTNDQKAQSAKKKAPKSNLTTSSTEIITNKPPETTYIYKVLALDRNTNTVAAATTTSSIHETSTPLRSASSILTHLDKPIEFFKHMEILEAQGYQLISGNRGTLVYRKRIQDGEVTSQGQSGGLNVDEKSPIISNPIREESVFSGPLNPKDRVIRAYQRANKSGYDDSVFDDTGYVAKPKKETTKRDYTDIVFLIACLSSLLIFWGYVAGNSDTRAAKEREKAEMLAKAEANKLKSKAQEKSSWTWF
jgi:hypothetical protein